MAFWIFMDPLLRWRIFGTKPKSSTNNTTLEPKWPLFLKVNPTKQGLVQSKQGSCGFQDYKIHKRDFTTIHNTQNRRTWATLLGARKWCDFRFGVWVSTLFLLGSFARGVPFFWGCFLAKAAETEPWKEDWASIRYTHCRHIKIISESFCSRDSFYIIWFCWASTCTKCACWISNQHQVHLRALGFIQPLKPIWNLKKIGLDHDSVLFRFNATFRERTIHHPWFGQTFSHISAGGIGVCTSYAAVSLQHSRLMPSSGGRHHVSGYRFTLCMYP